MNQSFTSFQAGPEAPAQSAAIYTHPDDVASDPKLTAAQKRAILASWISDARAVENSPALRRLDSGAVVDVDTILRALRALDAREPRAPPRWARKIALWNKADDDDDPPPAPAGLAVPFRPRFVAAYGARPQGLPDAACA